MTPLSKTDGIPSGPGCLEHAGVITQLLWEARENKGNLVGLWLDLAIAYGSIPHKVGENALKRHYFPEGIRGLLMDYYNEFHLKVSTGPVTSDWTLVSSQAAPSPSSFSPWY